MMENIGVRILSKDDDSGQDSVENALGELGLGAISEKDLATIGEEVKGFNVGECLFFAGGFSDAKDPSEANCGFIVAGPSSSLAVTVPVDQMLSADQCGELASLAGKDHGETDERAVFALTRSSTLQRSASYCDPLLHMFASNMQKYAFPEEGLDDGKPVASGSRLDGLTDLLGQASALADEISEGFKRVQSEPVNMRILSGRLEGAGAALGTISQNYDKMAGEMVLLVEKLRAHEGGALKEMHETFDPARVAYLVSAFLQKLCDEESVKGEEQAHILEAIGSTRTFAKTKFQDVADLGRTIPDTCRQVRRRINGLDVVKLLCRVESGRLSVTDGGLNGIIDRLELFHTETDQNLAMLAKYVGQIVGGSSEISDKIQ